ncbi:MAG TPA: hypothetical protein VJS47_06145 [Rhizomicrobium sp.]|nr:hypothetical protein [Rhizomicrobium sp.]
MHETIRDGFDVFLHDGGKSFGAVRQVRRHELVVYVENAGDFEIPFAAIKDAQDGKVLLDFGKLDAKLKTAIRRAHSGEDPNIP